MGRRILAMLICVALILGVYHSPSINVHASNDINEDEADIDLPLEDEELWEEIEAEPTAVPSATPTEIVEEPVELVSEETEAAEEVSDEGVSDEVTSDEEALVEEVLPEEEVKEETPTPAPLSENKQIGDLNICIDAPEGVFPAGTYAVVTEITSAGVISSIEDAVASQLSDSQTITNIRAFDITMYDAAGNEVQPDTDKGVVNVSIKNINTTEAITNPDKDMEVFHVEDSFNGVNAVDTTVLAGEVCFEAEHFSPYAVVSIEDHEADDTLAVNEGDLVESVALRLNGKELSTSEVNDISINDEIEVVYNFQPEVVITNDGKFNKAFDGYYVKRNNTYLLPSMPKELCDNVDRSIVIENEAGGVSHRFGTFTYAPDGKTTILIDDGQTDPYIVATDAKAQFKLKLNNDVKAHNDKYAYELVFGSKKYKINITEYKPKEPEVSKSASEISADGNITWTVTLTNNDNPVDYTEGYTFKDTLGEGHTYVPDSFKSLNGDTVTPTVSGNTISWVYKDNTKSKTIKFQYDTHVDFVALTKDKNENTTVYPKVKNGVKVTAPKGEGYDALEISASVTKQLSKTVAMWVDKVCTSKVNADGESEWKITIRNNGFNLKNVILHDKITVDSGEKITITGVNVDPDVAKTDVTPTYKNSLDLKFDTMSGDAVYTITYKAKIDDFENYLKENHNIPTNKAWIEYEYETPGIGDGWTKVPKGPSITAEFKGGGVTEKAAIHKKADGTNPADHTLTWTVEVNKNTQNLEEVKVTDIIPSDQEYVEIKDVKINNSDATGKYTLDVIDSNNVVLDFGDNLKGNDAFFRIVTKLTDEQSNVWASNNSQYYDNQVKLKSKGNPEVTDTASQNFPSTVIAKSAGKYNYDTHIIHYTITINQNEMEMNDVKVKDALDSKLEYVEGSYTGEASVEYVNNEITFSFAKINAKKVIEFDAKVKDGATFANNADSITVPNEASIISREYTGETKASCSTTFKNKVIDKRGQPRIPIDLGIVDYTVDLNVAKQDLYDDKIDEVIIEDLIGASFMLEKTSVKLYEATVDPDNGALAKTGSPIDAVVRVDKNSDSPKTKLQVVVPKDHVKRAYVLEYWVNVVNKKAEDYSNDVSLKGYGDSAKNTADKKFDVDNFSSVSLANFVYYITDLKDENNKAGKGLGGAHFELWNEDKSEMIDEADSDEDGEVIFVGALDEGKDYWLKETKAPDGYEIPEGYKDGVKVSTDGKGYSVADGKRSEHTLYNSKPSREITFELLDKKDNTKDLTKKGDDPNPPKIIVYKNGVEVWNSSKDDKPFKAIYGTEYEVKESHKPFGYNGDSVTGYKFMIDETDPAHELKITSGASENVVITGDKITMYDSPLDSITIKVNDVSEEHGMNLKGAEFTLKEGSEVIKKWTSDGDFKEIELPVGTYVLERTDAPEGFTPSTKTVTIQVEKNPISGELEIVIPTKGAAFIVDGEKITAPETIDTAAKKTLDDTGKAKLSLPTDIGELSLTPFEYKDGVPSSVGGTPEWTGTDPDEMKLSPQVQYLLTVTDKSGNKVTKIATINEKGELVVSDFIPPRKSAPAPAKSSSSGDSESSDSNDGKDTKKQEAPKEESKLVEDSKTVTTVKTKPRFGKVNKDRFRLAKTGGFMGTAVGYGSGYVLALAGILLVISNKKKRK